MGSVTHSQPTRSKKFIAAMTWNLLWLLLIGIGIINQTDSNVLLSMIWVSGTTQTAYIGGQAALDALVRKAVVAKNSLIPLKSPQHQTEQASPGGLDSPVEYVLEQDQIDPNQ